MVPKREGEDPEASRPRRRACMMRPAARVPVALSMGQSMLEPLQQRRLA
jgi:hypothetical protein